MLDDCAGVFALFFGACVMTAIVNGSWAPIVVYLAWIIGVHGLFEMLGK